MSAIEHEHAFHVIRGAVLDGRGYIVQIARAVAVDAAHLAHGEHITIVLLGDHHEALVYAVRRVVGAGLDALLHAPPPAQRDAELMLAANILNAPYFAALLVRYTLFLAHMHHFLYLPRRQGQPFVRDAEHD